MSDTPETNALLEQCKIKGRNPDPWKLCRKLERERNKLREALQSVMDWNPKPECWERPEAVARFEANMARAREVLEEAQEKKPHHRRGEAA